MLLYDEDIRIPPHARDYRVEKSWRAPADVLLLGMFPHMHLRGRSFRYEAAYPDGRTEVLLDVPRYDFAWQNRYVLAEPKRLPAGTVVRCIAVYDNSEDNPANPDPGATVLAGRQSWDEMFNGYFEWALADEDLTRATRPGEVLLRAIRRVFRPATSALMLAGLGALLLVCRRRAARARGTVPGPASP
jgi:hypothetical protein